MSIQMPVAQTNVGLIDTARMSFGGSKEIKKVLERMQRDYARDSATLEQIDRNPPPRYGIFDSAGHAKFAFIATGLIVAAFALVAFTCNPMYASVYTVGAVAALCLVHTFTTNGSFREGQLRQKVQNQEKDIIELSKSYRDSLERERPQAPRVPRVQPPARPAPRPPDDLDDSTL